jgi:hypothetical protein
MYCINDHTPCPATTLSSLNAWMKVRPSFLAISLAASNAPVKDSPANTTLPPNSRVVFTYIYIHRERDDMMTTSERTREAKHFSIAITLTKGALIGITITESTPKRVE